MFAAAKADLQPDLGGVRFQAGGIDRAFRNGDARQEAVQQGGLTRLDRPRLDPSERAQAARRDGIAGQAGGFRFQNTPVRAM